jgi:hypothetical protein
MLHYIDNTMRRQAAKSIVLSLGFIVILSIIYHDNKSPVFAQYLADNNHNFNFLTNTTFINNKTTTDSANITTLISDDFNIEGTINSQVSAKPDGVGIDKNNLAKLATNVPSQIYLLDGRWRLDVSGGNVTYFKSNITMITITGTEIHDHLIVFKPYTSEMGLLTNNTLSAHNISITTAANNNSISQNAYNNIIFSGAADITSNGVMQWRDVPISVSILNDKVISIALDSNRIDDHFFGAPIYGIVGSIEPLVSP